MRLLLNLITALTDEEAERLSVLKLRGKQEAVMNIVLSKRSSGQEPTPEEIAQLNLKDSHVYEISSVILGKCHKLLVPEGGLRLLEYLAYKNLNLQFKQELRRQKRKIGAKKGREAEIFYLTSFELLQRFTYSMLDPELIEEYGKLYLAAKKDPSAEDGLAIEARKLHTTELSILTEGKNFTKDQQEILEKLTKLEKIAKTSTHAYFCYSVYSALAWHWHHLEGKPDKSLLYLKLAVPHAIKLDGYIFRDTPMEMQFRLADAHFMLGGTQEAFDIFERTYSSLKSDHQLWRRNYFLFRYLEVLIYNGKYLRAEQLLKERFEPLFKLRPTSASATAATLFALLYLLTGDYIKAKEYLDIGIKLNTRGNFTLYNEVRNRYVEAAYYYLTGDWEYTMTLTHRALQYLRDKHIGLNKHIFGYYFKIIEASVEYHSKGTPFWRKLEEKYKALTVPSEGLFGLLLRRMRSTARKDR
jgi:tetratricopeptide (TPR) repeat protein